MIPDQSRVAQDGIVLFLSSNTHVVAQASNLGFMAAGVLPLTPIDYPLKMNLFFAMLSKNLTVLKAYHTLNEQ